MEHSVGSSVRKLQAWPTGTLSQDQEAVNGKHRPREMTQYFIFGLFKQLFSGGIGKPGG